MMEDEEYPSDSDQSDEDYNPDGHKSDVPSEVDSDGEAEDSGEDVTKMAVLNKSTSRKRKSNSKGTFASKRKSRKLETGAPDKELTEDKEPAEDKNDEDAAKKHADALWADFLGTTSESSPPEPKKPKITQEISKKPAIIAKEELTSKKEEASSIPERKTITEIFEFAGEKVEVQKVVEVTPKDAASSTTTRVPEKTTSRGVIPGRGLPRGGATAGIGSILGQLGKAKKITTLEKTKLDWNSFKQNEGIDEELQTFNKGKDGYLERQDFLERTDFRRFEIEKSQRQTSRRK